MEATKKKKAYLKPEMTKFEMKMEESFMIASKEEVESIINNTLGLLAYELDKLKKTKEVVYEDPDTQK